MSVQSLGTIIASIDAGEVERASRALDALGNPCSAAVRDRLDATAIHFVSGHALLVDGEGFAIVEFSTDGTIDDGIVALAGALEDEIKDIFRLDAGADLLKHMRKHRVEVGTGYFDHPGVVFCGAPGQSKDRILREERLARFITGALGGQGSGMSAMARLADVRKRVSADPELASALGVPPAPMPEPVRPSTASLVLGMIPGFACNFLWPIALPALLIVIVGTWWMHDPWPWEPWWQVALAALGDVGHAIGFVLLDLVLVLGIIGLIYLRLRRQEETDYIDQRAPDPAVMDEIAARENFGAQNHMVSITQRKPGPVRQFTLRLAFWIVTQLASKLYRPGFLSGIGTIHFARWVSLPGTDRLLFFSNYGGSWESYLEDFITRAHTGLTSIWSNTVGFPYARNLIEKGATDGERFKRYARRSMAGTPFWYSGYPTLTTANIRTNARIRRGLAIAQTEDEAREWLALFGSASRPDDKLRADEIQSLVLGGLGFLPHGACVLLDFAGGQTAARAWLGEVLGRVAFNDGRRFENDCVLTLGLSPEGLGILGLPRQALDSFPPAFLQGMAAKPRARILGDSGENAPEYWKWGGQAAPHVSALVYGPSGAAVEAACAAVLEATGRHGHVPVRTIPLKMVPKEPGERKEPFGFVDGVSQPVIRGTYRGLRRPDPIHMVEPGEFILGYPDNRGNLPPGPTMDALGDPDGLLPVDARPGPAAGNVVNAPRDIGANGSFLVIRQLEQDVDAFEAYCEAQAKAVSRRLGPPYQVSGEMIGAKLVGRWKDGTSLVRHPYEPGTRASLTNETVRSATQAGGAAPIAPPALPEGREPAGPRPARPDNDFLYGAEDLEGLRCPFGAHIRRGNPRDSLAPGSQEQVDITNRHRILRVGRVYDEGDGKTGVLFMCLNGDLERQFEFIQQTWLGSPAFHGLSCEEDPLLGSGAEGRNGYTIPTRDGPVRLAPLQNFIRTRGGGYYFLASRSLLRFLSQS